MKLEENIGNKQDINLTARYLPHRIKNFMKVRLFRNIQDSISRTLPTFKFIAIFIKYYILIFLINFFVKYLKINDYSLKKYTIYYNFLIFNL